MNDESRDFVAKRRRRNIVGAAFLAGAVWIAFAGATAAAPASERSAEKFVASVGQEVVSVLAEPNVAKSQRHQSFRRIFAHALDLDLMARRVLGRHWRKATEDQKESYVKLFHEYVLSIYAVQLGGYAGEKFAVLRHRQTGDSDSVVTARITREFGAPVDLNFRVSDNGLRLRIVDVAVAGVSLIVTKRSEFDAIIRREGLPGLLRRLDDKTSSAEYHNDTAGSLIAEALTAISSVPMLILR